LGGLKDCKNPKRLNLTAKAATDAGLAHFVREIDATTGIVKRVAVGEGKP